VNGLKQRLASWRQDRVLGAILRNSGYLFSSSAISTGLGFVQSVFAARLLGLAGFGVLGLVTVFASTVNRLFSFRMGELVVRYAGKALAEKDTRRAAAVVKFAMLTEALTSILAFLTLLLLAPLAAVFLVKDAETSIYITLYGISVLGSLIAESSNGVLQMTRKFNKMAVLNLLQALLTAGLIIAAFFLRTGWLVLMAYLIGKLILGIGPAVLALRSLDDTFGRGWLRTPMSHLPPLRELVGFAVSTNLSATINLVVRDGELLWVAYFLNPEVVGYYKVALAIVNFIGIPVDPLISTSYPEINHAVAERSWGGLRRLLRRVTALAGGWTAITVLGMVVLGPLLILLYGTEYLPAYPALLILLVGFGMANALFWNRTLLLSLGHAAYPFRVMLIAGVIKVLLAFVLVPLGGLAAAAALLSGWLAVSVGLNVFQGLRLVRAAESQAQI
jgi:O-antigen/teichoic acid export membrane protein